ncbi:hypothetical protein [Luteimonas saliphila]|uniref:hypothetical protein n=1 Tax=Luteimonas saliphila TaxID=2804919 RepID=UPI00192D5251|nr:hypothetical protein [Luteimonas saliphila]
MALRKLALAGLLLGALGWWYSPYSPRTPDAPAPAAGSDPGCPLPPGIAPGGLPLQTEVPRGVGPFRLEDGALTPLAGFRIEARVLAREDYSIGREAAFSPTDLALGWARMREDEVLARLDISQSSRWYRYRWQGDPPLPAQEIVRSSANMHMIPSTPGVARALRDVRRDDTVRIDGWLVQVDAPDGWRWRSSLTREDSGNGACELVYVCALRVVP